MIWNLNEREKYRVGGDDRWVGIREREREKERDEKERGLLIRGRGLRRRG